MPQSTQRIVFFNQVLSKQYFDTYLYTWITSISKEENARRAYLLAQVNKNKCNQ